jgi:caffeoyl-CoA O-methyltransferase
MANRTLVMTPALEEYLLQVGVQEPEILQQLRRDTAAMPNARMQIGPDQGRFMRWLVELIGAKQCLEIGVFTGYSALAVALGIPDGGRLVACDIDFETTQIAARYWELAGVADRIQLVLGEGMDTLRTLVADGQLGRFDFAFIDADKESYDNYYETCLLLLRVGGLLLIDNTLWSGRVADSQCSDPDTLAIKALNHKIAQDHRVSSCMVAIGDGLTLVSKR